MLIRLSVFLFLLISSGSSTQKSYDTIDGSYLKIDGLGLTLKKDKIINMFGKPIRIYEPKYECGFLAEEPQGIKFSSLDYGLLKFTGNYKNGYVLDELKFDPTLKHKVTFRNKLLSHQTTIKEFEAIFGVKVDGSDKMLYHKGADDGYLFKFSKGKLTEIEYWSPC
jgi:hypothetical protein